MKTRELLFSLFDELKGLEENIRKDNETRRQDNKVTQSKLEKLYILVNRFKSIESKLKNDVLDKIIDESNEKVCNELVNKLNEKIIKCETKLKSRLKIEIIENNKDNIDNNSLCISKMGEAFDFRTAASLLPKLNGTDEMIYQLIKGIKLYKPVLKAEAEQLLINYVLNACIPFKDEGRLKTTYASSDDLIKDIKIHFLPKRSAPAIIAELQNTKQGNKSIEEYGRSIETLMSILTITQTDDHPNSGDIFRNENEKMAIDVFAKGLRDKEIRTIIKSKEFDSLTNAIATAKEQSSTEENEHTLFSIRGSKDGPKYAYRGRQTYSRQFNNSNNNSKFSNYNNHNYRYNKPFVRGKRPYYPPRGNRTFNNRSGRVFTATKEEVSEEPKPETFFRVYN